MGLAVAMCNVEENQGIVPSLDVPKRSLRRGRELQNPNCAIIGEREHATFFSSCANDIFFPGHKTPPDGERSDPGDTADCSTLTSTEEACRSAFGCMYLDDVCVSVRDNAYCSTFDNDDDCINSPADICYWSSVLDNCQSRYQDCSAFDPEECVQVDGCMWFNDLEEGHQVDPDSINDQRGRCLADPCFRINNGKCTIQHTGGRCVWYTQEQNHHSGYAYPGCYQSPCNNRFNRADCVAQNDPETNPGPYQCIWCREFTNSRGQNLKLGCQNAELTSSAQCWNIKGADRNYPVPIPENEECIQCLQGGSFYNTAYDDGQCHFEHISNDGDRNFRQALCSEKCCQSSFCTCLNQRDEEDVRDDDRDSGLDINGQGTPRPTRADPTARPTRTGETARPSATPTARPVARL